ncbi:hypothetical protein TanjilG_08608 [Lupinus angustifolius]|uniref:Uncharacterized protein n=1 Tax=Lupinus angustifolius TaxID=3871 RepID=A0A4P1RPP8_LUPAN|nr:hypothetical protein TanjilG_08608 [Lupinus angustifolius]
MLLGYNTIELEKRTKTEEKAFFSSTLQQFQSFTKKKRTSTKSRIVIHHFICNIKDFLITIFTIIL